MSSRPPDPLKLAAELAETRKVLVTSNSSIVPDLRSVLEQTTIILNQEVTKLRAESNKGLLCRESSQALVSYIKTLQELIYKENELLDNMSDEDLNKISKGDK